MYCPNCGHIVNAEDNYCKNCGKNLRNVKVTIKSNDKDQIDMEETRIFKPLRNDGIDSTSQIKDIINAVDKKVKSNIENYKKNINLKPENPTKLDKEINDLSKVFEEDIKKEKKSDTKVDFNKEDLTSKILEEEKKPILKDSKDNKNSENFKEKREEIVKNPEKPEVSQEKTDFSKKPEKKKKSFKELFKDFINEDDDEFSIFSGLDKKNKNTDHLQNQNMNETLTDLNPISMENTMSIPKVDLEEELKKAEKFHPDKSDLISDDFKNVENFIKKESSKNLNKIKRHNEDITEISQNFVIDKDDTSQDFLYKDKEKKKSSSSNTNKPLDQKEDSKKVYHSDAKTFFEQVNEALKEEEIKKAEIERNKPINKIKSFFGDAFSKNKDNSKKPKNSFQEKETIISKDKFKHSKSEKTKKNLEFKNLDLENMGNKISLVDEKIAKKDKNAKIAMIIIMFILDLIAVSLAYKKFFIGIIFIPILKIVINLFDHYLAFSIASDKVWIKANKDTILDKAFFNWFVCRVFIFILFLINPFDGILNWRPIEAMTPGLISTVLLFLLTIFIALNQYKQELESADRINFIGWYIVPFIIIEIVSKLFFMLINFIII